MKYKAKYPELEAVRFDQEEKSIRRIRGLIGSENVKKESTYHGDIYYANVDGQFIPLRDGDYVFLRDNHITVRTVARFLDDYELVRE